MSTEQDSYQSPNRGRWRRRLLLGCGIALAAVLVVGTVAWWLVSRHLGDMLANTVREQAGAALNGRLEFAKLEVDLAGRAVLTDAAIYYADSAEPWIVSPRAVVGFDLFNILGPNRGRRAVTITLNKSRVVLIREPDGRFNLERLIKEREDATESIGLALNLRDIEIDFSDWCLLDQSYPQLNGGAGLGGELLKELGYDRRGNAETAVHSEIMHISGSIAINPERAELSLNMRFTRQDNGGSVTASGSALLDGTQYDINLLLKKVDLTSLQSYVSALFPKLNLAISSEQAPKTTRTPQLAAEISSAKLRLAKKPGAELALSGDASLANIHFDSASLPRVGLPGLRADYSSANGQFNSDLELHALGCQANGNLQYNLNDDALGGKLALACTNPAALAGELELAELPLSGAVKAQVTLSGSSGAPVISAQLGSDVLHYEELKLGKLTGAASLTGSALTVSDVKLSGGETDLRIGGNYNLDTGNGQFEIMAGPLPSRQALKLAALASPDTEMPQIDIVGSISAAVKLTITSAQTITALRVWSDRLTVGEQRLDNVDVQATLSPPNVMIDEAEALYTAGEPLKLAGFSSDGPLQIKLRASGSVSTLPGQEQASLAIIGEGNTSNLAPAQARISFKATGPANDPELRLQIKTSHALHPLVISAQGHYRKGYAPATASLSWQETSASFTGQVDIDGQRLDGKVTANDVDLRRFSGNQQLSGKLSLAADVGGTFREPSLKGNLTMPQMSLATDWRSYSVREMSADFELVEGDSISVSDGAFSFEGNQFTAAGQLGQAGNNLRINCADFNLFSVLAMVEPSPADGAKTAPSRPPLEIVSAGPLSIVLSGDLGDPHAAIEYTSGAGRVEGHNFTGAALAATATLKQAQITRFNITGGEGQLSLTGEVAYQPLSYSANVTVHGFDIGVLTPLIDNEQLGGLSGNLDGTLALSGGPAAYSADGQLTLRNGKYNGMAVSEARAAFTSTGNTTRITEGMINADGRVNLTGQIEYEPFKYALAMQFQDFNISAFTPLIDNELIEGMEGRLNGTLAVAGGNGQYNVDGELALKNGRFQGIAVSDAHAKVSAGEGQLDITDASVTAEGTHMTGSAHIGPRPADMRLRAQASSLDLALLSPFLPDGMPALSGKLAIEIDLKPGRGQYPDLELAANSTGGPIGAGGIRFEELQAAASIKNDNLRLQRCELKSGQSSLFLTAQLDLGVFKAYRNGRALPLDITAGSRDFNLDDVAELLPEAQRALMPGGTFTCENVRLAGTTSDPQLSGMVNFDITRMPAYTPYMSLIARASGQIEFTPGEFDIKRLTLTPAGGGGVTGSALVKGSGTLGLNPFALKSGALDLILSEDQYLYVNTHAIDPAAFGGAGGPEATLPVNFEGWVGGTVHITAPPAGARDNRPVIGGQVAINAAGQSSQVEMLKPVKGEQGQTPAAFRFDARDGLRIAVNQGTEFLYDRGSNPANLDMRAELIGSVTLRGVPGLADKNNPDALRIEGVLELPGGSMRLYRHIVRLDPGANRLTFTNSPGDFYPYLTARATLELPRVLTGGEVYTSTGGVNSAGGERGDLKVFFSMSNHKLDRTSDPVEAVQLSSDPALPEDQILAYLLGGAANVLTGSGNLSQFAQEELVAFGSSFISRYIEDELNLEAFRVGGSGDDDNPYFMDIEKELSPGFSVTYYRDFFSQTYQKEEYGVKYRILEQQSGDRYSNVELEVNFIEGDFRGTDSEFMFTWNTRF